MQGQRIDNITFRLESLERANAALSWRWRLVLRAGAVLLAGTAMLFGATLLAVGEADRRPPRADDVPAEVTGLVPWGRGHAASDAGRLRAMEEG